MYHRNNNDMGQYKNYITLTFFFFKMIENTYIQNMLNSTHALPLFPEHFVLGRYQFAQMMP